MILVLCDSFGDAQDAYDMFVSFLENNEPWSIKNTWDAAYCVETDDDLRYIFVYYRMEYLLWKKLDRPDVIDVYSFFDNLNNIYFGSSDELEEIYND